MDGKTSCRLVYISAFLLTAGMYYLPGAIQAADIAEFRTGEEHSRALVERMTNATVAITHGNSSGSGVIVSEDGLIMTAAHVIVKPGKKLTVILSDGRRVHAKALGCDYIHDAGLAQITDAGKWPFVDKGHSDNLPLGTWCLALGHQGGLDPGRKSPIRLGRILAVNNEEDDDSSFICTDATVAPGDSGGPLFDFEGRVIGINSRIGLDPKRENVHVPVDSFRNRWDELVRGKEFRSKDGKDSLRLDQDITGDLEYGKTDKKLLTGLDSVTIRAGRSTVTVLCNGKAAALGTVVRKEGYVLTKASELNGHVSCRIGDRELPATIVNQKQEYDLALLQVNANDLTPIEWASSTKTPVGTWLLTPDANGKLLALGMLGHACRKISAGVAHNRAVLGIVLDPNRSAVTIQKVAPDSPARKAGFRPGDVIMAIDNEPVSDTSAAIAKLGLHQVGDKVTVDVKRGGKTMPLTATLVTSESEAEKARLGANLDPNQEAATITEVAQNGPAKEAGFRAGDVIVMVDKQPTSDVVAVIAQLGAHQSGEQVTIDVRRDGKTVPLTTTLASSSMQGRLSYRRDGFPSVFTHDTLLLPRQCGGPIVDLNGQAVGLNIARVNRTASYALPADIMPSLVANLVDGAKKESPDPELAAIKAVQKLGGKIVRKDKGQPIIEIDFSGQEKMTDEGLKELKAFLKLQTLTLNGTEVTDDGLEELTKLKSLQALRLTGCTQLTDEGLKNLKELKDLQELRLGATQLTDAGLKNLKELKKLKILGVAGTKVTDAGLKELKELKDLRELNLEGTAVTPAGMAELRKALPKLKFVVTIGI